MSLPDGYDTWVGERGITLSGGQKQRIAIARTLLMDPQILILDDSTSSVDTQTEYLIQQALQRVMEGRTTFVIAQRLRTVKMADQILVLQDGEIVERGKHERTAATGRHLPPDLRPGAARPGGGPASQPGMRERTEPAWRRGASDGALGRRRRRLEHAGRSGNAAPCRV